MIFRLPRSAIALLSGKAGLTIAMTQLPSIFGVPSGGHNFLIECDCLLDSLVKCNMSFCSQVAIETIAERLLPGWPVALAWYQAGQGAGVIGAIVGAIIILVVWGFIAPRFERT